MGAAYGPLFYSYLLGMIRVVFTGGPGTGKSTLIRLAKQLGYPVMPDVAAALIRSGRIPPVRNPAGASGFHDHVLQKRIEQHQAARQHGDQVVFYDRGLPDNLGYSLFLGKPAESSLMKAIDSYRYDLVFFFPFWPDIYKKTAIRQESGESARQISDCLTSAYRMSGYSLLPVPLVSPDERIRFILSQIPGIQIDQ